MPIRTLMYEYGTMQVTWSYTSIVVDSTCQYQKVEVDKEGTIFWQINVHTHHNEK